MKLNDLVGKRFGMLVVISRADDAILSSGRKITAWKCICDCGSYTTVMAANLTSGHTRSCGCIAVKHGYARKERLYNIWVGMKQRCRDKNTKDYEWGDSILEDTTTKQLALADMRNDVVAGLVRPELYIMKKYGVTVEEAANMMPKMEDMVTEEESEIE